MNIDCSTYLRSFFNFAGQQKRDTPSLMIALAGDPQNPVSQFAVPSASAITHDTNGMSAALPCKNHLVHYSLPKLYFR